MGSRSRDGGGGGSAGGPVAELSLPRFAILTAVLPHFQSIPAHYSPKLIHQGVLGSNTSPRHYLIYIRPFLGFTPEHANQ